MAKNILIATPQPAFGEFLRLSLEESSHFRVRLVQTGREALSSLEQNIFSLVILDAGLLDPPFSYVVQGLRSRSPGIRLLVIPPAEGEDHPEIRAAQPDGCVSQPFYAPSLLEMIDHLTVETTPQPTADLLLPVMTGAEGDALQESDRAARVLEEFLKDSTAPAVLVLRDGQPWAWAGQFKPDAHTEVATLLSRFARANEGVDMARFVHLQADGGEYLIYATPLPDDLVLVMVYQVTTPLTVIRSQAMRLARLLHPPAAAPPPQILTLPAAQPLNPPAAAEGLLLDEGDEDDGLLEADAVRLGDFLAKMPTPNPAVPEPGDWVREDAQADGANSFFFPWERGLNRADPAAAPTSPAANIFPPEMVAAVLDMRQPECEEPAQPDAAETDAEGELADSAIPTAAALPQVPLPDWLTAAPPISGEDTQPVVLRTLKSLQQVEPIMPSFSHLAYTILLIPRLPSHLLVSSLADRLREWLPQLCLAYGWRLENLFVRPDYLQWTVQVAPAISPGNVIRLVRQQASRRIFQQFPQYEVENPSGDFWAPGFLIISGFQPPSMHLVHDFIRQTRTRQGNWSH